MSDHNSGVPNVGTEQANYAEDQALSKGKGKAVEPQSQDMSMDEDDDSSDEEDGVDDTHGEPEEEDEDNMEQISTENIINSGRRTRGKHIDFAKAAAEAGDADDDEEEDDEDFVEKDEDAMEH